MKAGAIISLLFLTVSLSGHAETFVKTQTLKMTITGEISGLKASPEGRFAVVYGDSLKYWLISGDKSLSLTSLVPVNVEELFPAPALTHANTGVSGANIINDWIAQLQWLNNKLILFAENNTYFYNPEKKKLSRSYPVLDVSHTAKKLWSEKYSVLVHGAQVYDSKGKSVQTEEDITESMHRSQSGLLFLDTEDVYVTADYHQQEIKLWSLPKGKLQKKIHLNSRHITDIALHRGQLLVASSEGYIESRSLDNAEKKWSIRPCKKKAGFVLNQSASGRIYYYCQSVYGFIQQDKNGWKQRVINKKQDPSVRLVSVAEINEKHVALGFSNGKVVVFDLENDIIEQSIHAEKESASPVPAYVVFLKNSRKLLVVEQKDTLNVYTYQ